MLEIKITYNYNSYNELCYDYITKSILTLMKVNYIIFYEYRLNYTDLISLYKNGKNFNLLKLTYYVNYNLHNRF